MGTLPCPWRSGHLFAFITFALLFSTSFAGRHYSFLMDQDAFREQGEAARTEQHEALVPLVQARMLSVKTNDYSSYDPSPSMDKPHFKLIPN
ncbi:protein CASPARIAN STRIP INTEGRITY FACTOR 1-like isoform X2 [Miscanthus floridulus]